MFGFTQCLEKFLIIVVIILHNTKTKLIVVFEIKSVIHFKETCSNTV